MKSRTHVLTSILTLTMCGCQPGQNEATHWSYSGSTGPSHWGDLNEDYILAKTGKQQSPIDIVDAKASENTMALLCKPTTLDLVNNGHAIQQDYEKGSVLKAGPHTYALEQFHIHSPSEHTVDGKRFDMEIHLVHQSEAGELGVVGILLQQGKENAFMKQFWHRLPGKQGERVTDKDTQLNIGDILPDDMSCYMYDGSLTTPPCTEGVKWFMLKTPVELSADQLTAFQALYKGNYRPVQPLNGRDILDCGN